MGGAVGVAVSVLGAVAVVVAVGVAGAVLAGGPGGGVWDGGGGGHGPFYLISEVCYILNSVRGRFKVLLM